ncbi:MAG: hypothetical protein U1F43_30495 [Myxococcota bacterium]
MSASNAESPEATNRYMYALDILGDRLGPDGNASMNNFNCNGNSAGLGGQHPGELQPHARPRGA